MSRLRELVIVSGKGGTGKTSLTAAFALLADRPVLADADVDATDLHLVLEPDLREERRFVSGHEAVIRGADCRACGLCARVCRFDAIRPGTDGAGVRRVDPAACEGGGVCVRLCPVGVIDFPDRECGSWSVSGTRAGSMVHARLHPGGENSGRLVSLVRQEARRLAEAEGAGLLLVDGPPGVGCPVIASLTGADIALVVTEPTPSGAHDMARVLDLAAHFGVRAALCINKADLHPGQAERMEAEAARRGARIVGRIPYDRAVTEAQIAGRSVMEHPQGSEGPAASAVRAVWERVGALLGSLD